MDLKIEAEDLKVMLGQLGYVKVIRCKECKYGTDFYRDGECYCEHENLDYIGNWNHYCGYAKRKDNEAD